METEISNKEDTKSSKEDKNQSSEESSNTKLNNGDCENGENQIDDDKNELKTDAISTLKEDNQKNDKVDGSDENRDMNNSAPTKNTRGKKRKASEMKDADENANEEEGKVESGNEKEKVDSDVAKVDMNESSKQESTVVKPDAGNTPVSEKHHNSEDANMSLHQSEALGKGKRARIPNKRYSDIMLSNSRRKSMDHNSSELEIKQELIEEEMSHHDSSQDSFVQSPSMSFKKIRSSTSDISDPKYLVPFDFGWKRELVYRMTGTEKSGRRLGDIYYYTPTGKKLRSMREVAEHLRKDDSLTIDNFTFLKEPLGTDDPEKEIIRDAKIRTDIGMIIKKTSTPTKKVLSPKIGNVEKVASPKPKTAAVKALGNVTPKEKMKVKIPMRAKEKKSVTMESPIENSVPAPRVTSARKSGKWPKPSPPESPSKPKKRNLKLKSITNSSSDERPENKFMDNYLQNISFGYNTLLYVFQYLKVQDLLRAGCVCTMWRDIASHPILWRTVRLKNSQVHNFEGLANTLKKHGTVHLDLRKMLLPNNGEEIWPEFSKSIAKVDTLRKIELCRCPATVVEQLAVTNPDLEVLNAVTIKCESMNLDPLKSFTKIRELRLKSTSGLAISSIDSLKELKTLKHLSLTSVNDLHTLNLNVIAELTNLESLDLGECMNFPKNFGEDILSKLENLEKLRLEKGQGNCHTFDILNAVKDMPKLEQLELVNFDVKAGFDKALGACQNIKKLMIIPTYISQSATTNHMVLGGVLRLQKTLSHFVWGVTLELLRVTELFVDQCEEPKEKKEKKPTGNGDSIPVLKPVPVLKDKNDTILPPYEPAQVEILPLPGLQKLLLNSLPTTRVKILKIPFHATWRQTLTDSVN